MVARVIKQNKAAGSEVFVGITEVPVGEFIRMISVNIAKTYRSAQYDIS